ncbi:hypothetical protein, partial [Hungatella hathewayi]|uniref:hypothetical protein n=2 Tax=Hungatella TaxID=1649459 RepID=UPI001A9A5E73
ADNGGLFVVLEISSTITLKTFHYTIDFLFAGCFWNFNSFLSRSVFYTDEPDKMLQQTNIFS